MTRDRFYIILQHIIEHILENLAQIPVDVYIHINAYKHNKEYK